MKDRVIFDRPNLKLFDSLGMNAIDMHFHTRFSDTTTKISDLLKRASKIGCGVAITDHNEIGGVIRAQELKKETLVIPGIEVSCYDGPHILLYFYSHNDLIEFYDKHIKSRKTISPYMAVNIKTQELIEKSMDYSCIRAAAHPYGYLLFNKGLQKCIDKRYLEPGIADNIEAIEVICGGMTRRFNKKAVELSKRLGKGITGGTDGHTLTDLGKVVTASYAEDIGRFLDNIRKNRSYVVGKEQRKLTKLVPMTKMMTKYARYIGPSIRMHYELNMPRVKRLPKKLMEQQIVSSIKTRIGRLRNNNPGP